MTAADSAAHDRSAAPAGAVPPSRGSSRIRASRASCAASSRCRAVLPAMPPRPRQQPGDQPERHSIAALPGPQQVQHGCPAAPARPAAQSSTASASASPASARRSATLRGDGRVGRPGQDAGRRRRPDRSGRDAPRRRRRGRGRGSAHRPGQAATRPAGRRPAARSRSPGRRPWRSAPGRCRWRRTAAGPRPTGRACAAGARPDGSGRRRRGRRPAGRSARPATGRVPASSSASRTASADTHGTTRTGTSAWVNVGGPAHSGRARTPEHPALVVLAARLVQQRPQHRKRRTGRRLGHSCTRHSTITCSSGCASRNAVSSPSTSLAGAPLARVAVPPGPAAAAALMARPRAAGSAADRPRAGRRPAIRRSRRRWPQGGPQPCGELVRRHRVPQGLSGCWRQPGPARPAGPRPPAAGRAGPNGMRPAPRRRPAPPGSASWPRAVSVAGSAVRASVSTSRTRLLGPAQASTSDGPGAGGRQPPRAVRGQAQVLVGHLHPGDQRRSGVGHARRRERGSLGELGDTGGGEVRVDVDAEQRLGARCAACQSAGAGSGSGRSSISGRTAPGRGAGMGPPCWYQARCRSAAQASTTRSATSSRRPSSGRIASIQSRTCPTVTVSCGCRPSRAAARSNSAPQG